MILSTFNDNMQMILFSVGGFCEISINLETYGNVKLARWLC